MEAPAGSGGLGWAALGAVFALVAVLAWRAVGELDLGFHLRAGEWILANRWPRLDPFTYTVSDRAYVDLHWLYQVALVGLFRLGGSAALVAAHAALILAAFAVVARLAWDRLRSVGGVAALLVPGVRPNIVNFVTRGSVGTNRREVGG